MSESQAVYQDDLTVRCRNCGAVIGQYERRRDQVWLRVGIISCRTIRAVCQCGAEFDFDSSQKRLEKLIERSRRLKDML